MADDKKTTATGKKLKRSEKCGQAGCAGRVPYVLVEVERNRLKYYHLDDVDEAECPTCGARHKLTANGSSVTATLIEDGEGGHHERETAKKEGDA